MPVEPIRWQGAAALQLSCGATTAVVAPSLGMTAVSLRHEGLEYVDAPVARAS